MGGCVFPLCKMSIRIMNHVWDTDCANCTRKLVMLALADNANDEGVCWPSITTIALKCSMSDRAVTKHVRELETDGLLSVERIAGSASKYYLTFATPERRAVLHDIHHPCIPAAPAARTPLNDVHHTPERRAGVRERVLIGREIKAKKAFKAVQAVPDQALIVYDLYPRKIGKPKALASIQKAIKKFGFEKVKAATLAFSKLWQGHADLTFCPHPTTWFNQERFNDDMQDQKPKVQASRQNGKQSPNRAQGTWNEDAAKYYDLSEIQAAG
jgi:helix-turn-helix protein